MLNSDKILRSLKWMTLSLFFISSCTPSRLVKPLKKGEQTLSGSFGGPLIKFSGAPIPLPFSTVSYAKGLTNKVSGFAGLHTTALLFGNFQTDLGACIDAYSKNKIGISITPAIQAAVSYKDINSFRLWPSIDLNARYEFDKGFLYLGTHNWLETSKMRVHETKQNKWILPTFHLGFTKTNTKWNHQFEAKWYLPSTAVYPGVVDYIGLNKKGAFGIFYCITRKF
jgi:hypothetical protein